jgi:WD40 repeat protein
VPHSIHSNTTLHQLYRYSTDGRTHETVIEDLKAYSGAVTISPDGKLLAIAEETPNDEPKPINVWDLSTGKLKQRFGGHWGHIDGLAFSPDGKKLASFSSDGGIIKIWNLDGSVRGPQL